MSAIPKALALWVVSCIVGALPLFAATFKWVDEKGQVHYSQTPPDNRNYDVLHNPAPPVNEEPTPTADRAPSSSSTPPPAAENTADNKESREKACQDEQARLNTLQNNNARRIVVKQEDGSAHRLTEEERQDYIKDAAERLNTLCK